MCNLSVLGCLWSLGTMRRGSVRSHTCIKKLPEEKWSWKLLETLSQKWIDRNQLSLPPGADPGLWSGGPSGIWTPRGGPEPKICSKYIGVSLKIAWKLHDFEEILGAKGGGSVLPGPPPRIRFCLHTNYHPESCFAVLRGTSRVVKEN